MTREDIIREAKLLQFSKNPRVLAVFISKIADEKIECSPEPQGLDEAAHKYSDGENPACPCEECLIKTFKAGAEWREQQIPKLPDNLDKAAEKYAKENCENYVDEEDGITYIEEALRNTFKAGAEWMAGQGENKEGDVLDHDEFIKFSDGTYIDLDPTLGLIPAFKLKDGDKVVVQIRKK